MRVVTLAYLQLPERQNEDAPAKRVPFLKLLGLGVEAHAAIEAGAWVSASKATEGGSKRFIAVYTGATDALSGANSRSS